MKRWMRGRFVVAICAMTIMTGSANSHAEETSKSASVGVMSKYIWRGMNLSKESVIQPSVGITYGSFGANLWSNYDMDISESNETDLTLNYTTSMNGLSLDIGYIYYGLAGVEDTQELFITASSELFLSPSLALYYDFDLGDGAFLIGSLGHSIKLDDVMSLDLGASASFNFDNKVMGVDSSGKEFSGLYNGELTASVSYTVSEDISITPKVAYSFPLSDDAENALTDTDGDDSFIYGGINLSLSF